MKLFDTITRSAFFALCAANEPLTGVSEISVLGPSGGGQQTHFREAYHSPNATRSVPITLGYKDGWTWRVNVTEVSAPGASDPASGFDPVEDSHVVAFTYDLQWPNASMSLNETMETWDSRAPTGPLCHTAVAELFLPNVTDYYQESDEGSCEGVFGKACANAILGVTRHDGHGCSLNGPSILSLAACEGVFENMQGVQFFDISRENEVELPNATRSTEGGNHTNTYTASLNASDAYYVRHSAPYTGNNDTIVQQAKSTLHMSVLSSPTFNKLLCMRVDPSVEDNDISPLAESAADHHGGLTLAIRVGVAVGFVTMLF